MALSVLSAGFAHASTHYVIDCMIFDGERKLVKSFPGNMCIFLKDGTYVRYQEQKREMVRIDPRGKVIWRRSGFFHHQLKLTEDGRKIVTLFRKEMSSPVCVLRHEGFALLDLESGKIRHYWSSDEHLKTVIQLASRYQLNKTLPLSLRSQPGGSNPYCDYSHFNSISEIPENPLAQVLPAFKKGNFIANLYMIGAIVIFDPDLKAITWSMEADAPQNLHDVQVLNTGEILLYQNSRYDDLESEGTATMSLQRLDPVTGVTRWRYPVARSREFIFPEPAGQGGVQVMPDGVLFNFNSLERGGRAYFLGLNGRIQWNLPNPLKGIDGKPLYFQEIKAMDLEMFLRNSRL